MARNGGWLGNRTAGQPPIVYSREIVYNINQFLKFINYIMIERDPVYIRLARTVGRRLPDIEAAAGRFLSGINPLGCTRGQMREHLDHTYPGAQIDRTSFGEHLLRHRKRKAYNVFFRTKGVDPGHIHGLYGNPRVEGYYAVIDGSPNTQGEIISEDRLVDRNPI
ncbi:MAG: hypothetical protein ACD_52C00067G0003 [uncultured bacterium]|nr:MAG: hypothetical protein ACD_52C00067G0003 [uncultured bacterium]